jgi:hypothetical protein
MVQVGCILLRGVGKGMFLSASFKDELILKINYVRV